jgi:hypothetical protein
MLTEADQILQEASAILHKRDEKLLRFLMIYLRRFMSPIPKVSSLTLTGHVLPSPVVTRLPEKIGGA